MQYRNATEGEIEWKDWSGMDLRFQKNGPAQFTRDDGLGEVK